MLVHTEGRISDIQWLVLFCQHIILDYNDSCRQLPFPQKSVFFNETTWLEAKHGGCRLKWPYTIPTLWSLFGLTVEEDLYNFTPSMRLWFMVWVWHTESCFSPWLYEDCLFKHSWTSLHGTFKGEPTSGGSPLSSLPKQWQAAFTYEGVSSTRYLK